MKATILLIAIATIAPSALMADTFAIGPFCEADSAEPEVCVAKFVNDWINRDGIIFYEAGSALSRSFCAHPKLVLKTLHADPSQFKSWVERMATHTFFVMDHPEKDFGIAATAYLQTLKSCMLSQANSLLGDADVGIAAQILVDALAEMEIRYVDQV